jgi:hypothetical protein
MRQLSNAELDAIETQLPGRLPGLYRKLLVEVGAGEEGAVEIYHPLEIEELYRCHFDDPQHLFNIYFPIGCNNRSQEIWLIRIEDDRAASISHETHPDDYPEERWLSYETWLAEHESILPT